MTTIYTPEQVKAAEKLKQEATDKRNREFHHRRRAAEARREEKENLIAMGLWIGDAA